MRQNSRISIFRLAQYTLRDLSNEINLPIISIKSIRDFLLRLKGCIFIN